MKKKILHISPYYLPHYGGIEQVSYDVVSILKEDFEQKVICFNDKRKTEKDKYDDIEIIRVGFLKKISSQAISLSYFFQLKKVIHDFKPDYIHFHAPNPLISLYLMILIKIYSKIKIVIHWHSDIIEQVNFYKLYRLLEKIFLKNSYKIIVTSKNYVEGSEALKKYKDKIKVIYNIIDENKINLKEDDLKEIDKIKKNYENKKIVFFIGVHRKYKGIKYLIESTKYLDDKYQILIAGKGVETEKLKKLAKGNKKIKFLGRITDEEKKIYLYASDVFAFPSISKNEAFGVALAEALYCGLPAITFFIEGSGVSWVNRHEITGIEVENRNAKEFSKAIKAICENEELRDQYSTEGKKWIRNNFTKEKIKKNLLTLYRDYN